MSLITVPDRILNAAVNLATGGITVRQLAKRLRIAVGLAQQAVTTLIHQGRLYETRTTRQTSYHAIMTFINRIAALGSPTQAADPAYDGVIAHLTKHRNRKWPLGELAQQLKLSREDLTRFLDRAISEQQVGKHHVGALALYGLT